MVGQTRLPALHLALILLWATLACSPERRASPSPESEVLRIGVLPDQAVEALQARYTPLMEYLQATIGVRTEFSIPKSYQALLDDFAQDRIDVAWFGGLTFIRAERDSQAVPLAMRDVDLVFTTDYVVSADAPEGSVEDFAERRFCFGPELSTSGHLMPRYFLVRRGVEPETFFRKVLYSAGHDQTVVSIRDGESDLGAVNSVVLESMFRAGRVSRGEVRILERTPPFRNYLWAVQPHLEPTLRVKLLDALLALDLTVPSQRAILDAFGARGFIPAIGREYDDLRGAADFLEPTHLEEST